jgi:hypothetical protein
MVQLDILTGKKAGTSWVARRFPVRLGRAMGADLQVEEPGVWEQHLELQFVPGEGIVLAPQAEALVTVNGKPAQRQVLRNGDTLDLGGLKLRFWLVRTRQGSMRFREVATWLAIAAISLGQIGLVYWLLNW